ncbi:MAG: alkaline phosphatase family protein [Candidatus Nitrosocaldaceae archaeon]
MKIALIGLDAALPSIVNSLISQNRLPNMQYLRNNGVWSEGVPVFPTVTSTNWTTISTGAMPSTHGITDMVIHQPNTELTEISSAFYSNYCKAEHIWETCERFNKVPLLLKYIASWPPEIKDGIQIEGFGAPGGPGSRPWGSSPLAISNASCYSTTKLENSKLITFSKADQSSWKGIVFNDALESTIEIGKDKKSIYNILIELSNPKQIILTKDRDASNGLVLQKGVTSKWIIDEHLNAVFRSKLMQLEYNGSLNFKLYISQVFPLEGFTYPTTLSKELIEKVGPFIESISHFPFVFNWVDADTYLEEVEYQADWFAKAANYLTKRYRWDLFMMQWHGIDNTQHAFLRFDKSILDENEKLLSESVTTKTYEIADRMVGDIVKGLDKDTCIFVLSDHGHIIGKRRFFINSYLLRKGYINLKLQDKKLTIDWSKTVAYAPAMVHIYLNVKGRDPHGIVEKGKEYEDLVEEIIDVLYDIKDPITNTRPIAFALSNNDAEVLGINGDRSGDIIYVANPGFAIDNRITQGELFEDLKVGLKGGSIHGQQLGSVDLKEHGTIRSMFIAYGPNIKKNYVRDKPIRFIDIAPTISYILDIPSPKHSEGRVMYDIFE